MIQVILVDDDPQFRHDLCVVFEQSGECIVVGESINPTEVIEMAQIHHPAIVILNGDLTACDACDACDAIEIAWLLRSCVATVSIIILTQFPVEERLFQFLKVGANAYKMRTISPEVLIETVRRVSSGEFLFSCYSS
jgi:DNA-binding NarL/FixJ family response regulator